VLSYPLLEDGPMPPTRTWIAPSILLALLCWNRPDGPIFVGAACAGLIAARGFDRTAVGLCVRLAAIPLAAIVAHLTFRVVYYGDWLPNSAYAKVALTPERLMSGLEYVGSGGVWLAGLILATLVAVMAGWSDATTRRRVRFLVVPFALWGAYVIVIGGDVFPARRHLVALIVILTLMLAQGLAGVLTMPPRKRALVWAVVPCLLAVLAFMQRDDPENLRARDEHWEWDGQVAGRFLDRAFGREKPLLAVDAAGTLPYFSSLPSIDLLGINDRYLAHHRPSGFGRGYIGHELGSGRYVIDRRPDLVLFFSSGSTSPPKFRSEREMLDDPRFTQLYRVVTFQADDPYRFRSRFWVAERGRVGIERDGDRVSVPGYLLMANPASTAKLDRNGAIAVEVIHGDPAGIRHLRLEPGRWSMRVESSGATRAGVRVGEDRGWTMAPTRGPLVFEVLPEDVGENEVMVSAEDETAYVSRVVFEREPRARVAAVEPAEYRPRR
jgi:hypothetical protein